MSTVTLPRGAFREGFIMLQVNVRVISTFPRRIQACKQDLSSITALFFFHCHQLYRGLSTGGNRAPN